MSKLMKEIDNTMGLFATFLISKKKYKIEKKDFMKSWDDFNKDSVKEVSDSDSSDDDSESDNDDKSQKKKNTSPPKIDTEVTREKALKATKTLLSAMCKAKGLVQSGNKDQILKRILDHLDNEDKKTKSSTTATSTSVKKTSTQSIPSMIADKKDNIDIKKNKFGNFEHMETGIVFNKDKYVIGKQNSNGNVDNLTDKEIDLCKKFKFQYKIPDNLNTNKGLSGVKVDELDDEEDELDDDDLEEEEELEDELDLEDD